MKTKFIGHRGAKGEAPENTLKGIEFGLKQGLNGVEIDVHLSKDQELMVIHDATLDRTTSGQGPVKDKTFIELRELNAGEGEKIPTLGEVVELVKIYKGDLFIELKAPNCEEKVIELIKQKNYDSHCIVKSFNHQWIKNVKSFDSSIKTQCLMYARPLNPVEIIKAAMADGLSISTLHLDKELVLECHQEGYFITTWNANDKVSLKLFKEMGVDYICTDFAGLIPSMPL